MCALKLKRTVNFVDHEYWVAEKHENLRRKGNKRTEIIMMLYTSEAARNAGQEPVLRERLKWDLEGNEKNGKDVYDHVKLSRKETKPIAGSEQTEEVETNEFVTAEDIL
jgi:hypothetical protein